MELIRAIQYKEYIGYIHRLIQDGADVNVEDGYGHTALMIASGIEYTKTANLQAMRLLIQNGANVNAIGDRYRHRHTPLIAASGFNNRANFTAIKLLIESGADVNIFDVYRATPLMYAAGIQKKNMANIEAFKLLLANGADMDIVNINGYTVFTVCKNPYNSEHLYLFQSAINSHYRKQNLIYMAAIKNSATVTKIGKFAKISNSSRQDWKRHINSFLSLDIEKCI